MANSLLITSLYIQPVLWKGIPPMTDQIDFEYYPWVGITGLDKIYTY